MNYPQQTTSDDYLRGALNRYAVPRGQFSPTVRAAQSVVTLLDPWMRDWRNGFELSGSYAKQTAVRGSSDCDIFISLSSTTPGTLADINNSLIRFLPLIGFSPRTQNVSVAITHNNIHIDLVPARRQGQYGNDHSLYNRRRGSWIQTNIQRQIQHVTDSGRTEEIRAMKIWRNLRGLDFPSYYLELAVIETLRNRQRGNLSANIIQVLEFLANTFEGTTFIDPANSNNAVSDDLNDWEKMLISHQAQVSLQGNWNQFIW